MFQSKKKTGIDIGTDTVKLASLTPDGGSATALWQEAILPERASRDDNPADDAWLQRIVSIVQTYLRTYPNAGREFNMAVPGDSMIYHYLELPRLKKKEVELAVTSQAYKLLPIKPESCAIASLEIPPLDEAKDVTAALVTAVERDTLQRMRQVLDQCDVVAGNIEVPVLSLTRELYRNRNLERGRFYGLVHAGFRLTRVAVVRDGFPYQAREFSLAGRDFTYAFQMSEQCTWQEAEQLKQNCDVAQDVHALEPFLQRWMDEVRKSLHALKALHPQVEIAKVFLSGGSAAIKNLAGRLSAYLNVPVELDTWDRIKPATDSTTTEGWPFKIAVGLGVEK